MLLITLDEDTSRTGNIFTETNTGHPKRSLAAGTYTTDAGGTVTISSKGAYTYTPPADYYGSDSFSYTVLWKGSVESTNTASITVSNVNDNPIAQDDFFLVDEGTALSANLLVDNGNGADSDIDGDTLGAVAQTITTANGGTVVIQANGDFTYTGADGFTGVDNFTYTLSDGSGGTDTATAQINIIPQGAENTGPVAANDAFSVNEDTILTGNVLADNGSGVDADADGDLLQVTARVLMTQNGGTVELLASGDFTYTPAANFHGTDQFTYEVGDGRGGTDTATTTIDITSVNDNPLAVDDTFVTGVNAGISGNLLADNGAGTDSDADGDALSVTAASFTTGAGGTVTISTTGNFTYTPASGYTGTDSFTYTLLDGNDGTGSGTATINVRQPNLTISLNEDTARSGNLFAESGADGSRNTIEAGTFATIAGGTVIIQSNGNYSYAPAADFNGNDSFEYTIIRHNGRIDSVNTALVNVQPVNDAPVAANDFFAGFEDTVISGNLLADNGSGQDSDIDRDVLSVVAGTYATVAGGTVVIDANGDFTYTPLTDYFGSDSFSYTLDDGNGGTDSGDVTLTLASVVDFIKAPAEGGTIHGNPDADRIEGAAGIDIIYGHGGDDVLKGHGGNDTIYGGDGNDIIYGNPGDDILHGEDGNDTLLGHDGADTIYGGLGDDVIYGGSGADLLYGGDGNDMIDGGDDDDVIFGEAGDDRLYGRLGNDTLDGGDGNDRVFGNEGDDIFIGGLGQDYYNGGAGIDLVDYSSASAGISLKLSGRVDKDSDGIDDDWLVDIENARGSAHDDLLIGDEGANHIYGGGGNDVINGLGGDDTLYGEDGDDKIDGGSGDDTLYGGTGNDQLYGRLGNDTLYGEDGADRLFGHEGQDVLYGGEGDDYLNGGADDDLLFGGPGNDKLYGEDGNDMLDGGAGDDLLNGGAGNDNLYGGDGIDTLLGGDGNDLLVGGAGKDKLFGGAGSDTFGFTDASGDVIYDFDIAEDKLNLTDLLSGFDTATSDINDFVTISHRSYGFDVLVNDDGIGTQTVRAAQVLTDIADTTTAQDLLNQGILIVDQSIL